MLGHATQRFEGIYSGKNGLIESWIYGSAALAGW